MPQDFGAQQLRSHWKNCSQVLFLGYLSIQVSGEKGQIIHHCGQLPQKQLKSGHVLEVILQEAKIAEWENVKN